MSRIWLAVLLLYPTNAVSAASNSVFENCVLVGELARQVMTDRQKGIDRSTTLTFATATPDLRELLKGMAEVAYSFPAYQTPHLAEQAVAEFGDSLQLACEARRSRDN